MRLWPACKRILLVSMLILSATLISRRVGTVGAVTVAAPFALHTSEAKDAVPSLATPPPLAPTAPLVTDLTGTSFAVVFTTLTPQQAYVEWGTSASGPLTNTAYDDRDPVTGPASIASTVHRIVLSGLSANTTYYYRPVVGNAPLGNSCGQAFQQATLPTNDFILPFSSAGVGTVTEADGTTAPLTNTVLLLGVWTNSDGSTSWPVSTFNANGTTYQISSPLVNSNGTAPFFPDGAATLTVSAYADSLSPPGQWLSGVPESGSERSTVTLVPAITLLPPQSGSGSTPTSTNTPAPQTCTPTVTPTPVAAVTPPPLSPTAPLVTDLTGTSFAVVFTTLTPQQAYVEWGTSASGPLTNTAYDDRDPVTGPASIASTVHRIVLSGLSANTTYYYRPVVGNAPLGNSCGQAFQQATLPANAPSVTPVPATGTATATPVPATYLTKGAGTVQEADTTAPVPNTVLLLGVWTNSDGSTSWPVSALNANGTYYQISSFLVSADGQRPFYVNGNASFAVSAYADSPSAPSQLLLSSTPQIGSEGSNGAVVPLITLLRPRSGPINTPTNTPVPAACTATNTPTTTPSSTATGTVTGTPTSTPTSTTQSLVIPVQVGWNLISLSLQPSSPTTAQQLLSGLIKSTGGSFVSLNYMTNGVWSTQNASISALGPNGDFPLQPGVGYLLYTDTAGTVTETGIPLLNASVNVPAGWSLIGLSPGTGAPATAQQLLSGLIARTGGSFVSLNYMTNGVWSTQNASISALGPNGNFPLQPGIGYLLYTDTATTYPSGSAAPATAAGRVKAVAAKAGRPQPVPQWSRLPLATQRTRTAARAGKIEARGRMVAALIGRRVLRLWHRV